MKKRTLFLALLILVVVSLSACAAAEAVDVPFGAHGLRLGYAEEERVRHLGADMEDLRLISVWDDMAYFIYTYRTEGDSTYYRLSTRDNRLAQMQTDGTGIVTFGSNLSRIL